METSYPMDSISSEIYYIIHPLRIPPKNFDFRTFTVNSPIQFILNNTKVFGTFLESTQYGLIIQYKSEYLLIQPSDVTLI